MTELTNQATDHSDVLPAAGWSREHLCRYITRCLGGPIWEIEIPKSHILDAIQDAMMLYSQWRPLSKYWALRLSKGKFSYLADQDMGMGVVDVQFVEPNPVPTEIFYGNLIDPAPLFRTGLDEYDTFLRWRKVWQRVTSVRPDWLWDDDRRALLIHNPIERFHAGILAHFPHTQTEKLPPIGALWVKDYALARAQLVYGEILSKFSGAVPGPLKDLQLDSSKRDRAEKKIEQLEQKLFGMQQSTPISID